MAIIYNMDRPHAYGPNGAMSTSNSYGAQAGLAMLEAGGNAADAVVAAGLVACVVEPFHAGLGGGCFITYYDKASRKVHTFDARGVAPIKAHMAECQLSRLVTCVVQSSFSRSKAQ